MRSSFKSWLSPILTVALIYLPSLAQTRYVDHSSCVEGDGSTVHPYRTVRNAVSTAPDGTTLVIEANHGGSYPESDLGVLGFPKRMTRSEEHTSELQSLRHLV